MPILESPEIEDLCKSYLDLISALYKLFNDYSDRLLGYEKEIKGLAAFGAAMLSLSGIEKEFLYKCSPDRQKICKDINNSAKKLLSYAMEAHLRMMISNCAYQIHMPAFTDTSRPWASPKILKSLLSPSTRKKLVFVDRRSTIWHAIQEYLRPIFNSVTEENYYAVDFLAWHLYCLTIATKKECELPISPSEILRFINTIRQDTQLSQEAQSRLSNIEGIVNMFSIKDEITGLRILPKIDRFSVTERIDEILADAYLLETSCLRRFFCFSANKAALKRDLSKIVKFIVEKRSWAKGLLAVAPQHLTLGSSNVGVLERLGKIIPEIQQNKFSPVLLPPLEVACYEPGVSFYELIRSRQGWKPFFVHPDRD